MADTQAGRYQPEVKIFLVRHGETVDNVAQLLAGSTDSALTSHGVEQARRLGRYLTKKGVNFTHVFSSPLQRTLKTTELILSAYDGSTASGEGDNEVIHKPRICCVASLTERDFGSFEGKPYHLSSAAKKTLSSSSSSSSSPAAAAAAATGAAAVPVPQPTKIATPSGGNKLLHQGSMRIEAKEEENKDPEFVEKESKESLAARADNFISDYLLPILDSKWVHTTAKTTTTTSTFTIGVISHGILLSVLWRRLLLRLPRAWVVLASELRSTHGHLQLEQLSTGWSNTGFLELGLRKRTSVGSQSAEALHQPPPGPQPQKHCRHKASNSGNGGHTPEIPTCLSTPRSAERVTEDIKLHKQTAKLGKLSSSSSSSAMHLWEMRIMSVNCRDHLKGLKRTRGGVGSSKFDEKQKTIENFFKKRRT